MNDTRNMKAYYFSTKVKLPEGMSMHDLKTLLESGKLDIFISPSDLDIELILGARADDSEWCAYVEHEDSVPIISIERNSYPKEGEGLFDYLARCQDRSFLLWAWENMRDTYKGAVRYDEFVVLYDDEEV